MMNFARSGRAALAAAIAATALAAAARAGDVGVDAVHGWSGRFVLATGSAFDSFRAAIEAEGHRVVPVSEFGAARLASLDGLVLLQAFEQNDALYSPEETAAIQEFVRRGGGLVALGEAGSGSAEALDNWNRLVEPFGVAFQPATTEPAGRTITAFAEHPVTAGVAATGVDWHRPLSTIRPPAFDLTAGTARDDAFAAAGGSLLEGRAFFCGDTSLFMDDDAGSDRPLSFADNARLLANVLAFVLEPPHVRCLAGNVDSAAGPSVDVLFVNDSAGGPLRRVEIASWEPIDVFVSAPPSATSRAPFVLYGWIEEPGPLTLRELPRGLGHACRPMPFVEPDAALRVVWNSWGHGRVFGAPRDGTEPAPASVLHDPDGARRPLRVFLQGLIADSRSPSGIAAVTNGLTLVVR